MARTVTPLSDAKCEAAKPQEKDYKLFDGQGLFLLVKANGTKTWRFKFTRPDGREGLATFGHYPILSLKAARERRLEALTLLASGRDPVIEAQQAKIEAAYTRENTFEALALEWHTTGARRWSEQHAVKILRMMELHLFPSLGKRSVTDLKARDLLMPLKLVERRNTLELAKPFAPVPHRHHAYGGTAWGNRLQPGQ